MGKGSVHDNQGLERPDGCPSVSSLFPFLLLRVSAPRSARELPAALFKDRLGAYGGGAKPVRVFP